jgi:Spy/CpxP family protein refolding chaperone
MNRTLKLSLLCAGIFTCGVVAGGLGARKFIHAPPTRPHQPQGGGQPEGFGPQQLRRLSDELGLSEAQKEKLLPILEKAGDELRQLRRESWRQSSVILQGMEAAVAELLTPEQREKLAVLQAEREARMKARMEERNRRKTEGAEPRREGERPERRPDEGLPPPPRPETAPDAPPSS